MSEGIKGISVEAGIVSYAFLVKDVPIEGHEVSFAFCETPGDDTKRYLAAREKAYGTNDRGTYCALSGEKLTPDDGIYAIIGHSDLFPNCVVSMKRAEAIGPEETVRRLLVNWRNAQKYRCWF